MRNLILLLIALALSACVAIRPIDAQYQGQDAGYVVVSLSKAPDANFSTFGPLITRAGTERTGAVDGVKLWIPPTGPYNVQRVSFFEAGGPGAVFVLRLSSGQYQLGSFSASRGISVNAEAWGAEPEINIPFEVRPGRVVYLGSYLAKEGVASPGFFGSLTQLYFERRTEIDRDLSVARRVFSDLPTSVEDLSSK